MGEDKRVVVVTGSASGIGRECALQFARHEGAAVVVADLDAAAAERAAEEVRAAGGSALVQVGDVTDESFVARLVHEVGEWRGRVDVLVNNAGVADELIPSEEQRVDDWQRILDISLRGMFLFSTQVARHFMLPQEHGRIVSMGSLAGIGGLTKRNAYSAAKAGVLMMTRTLGTEWMARGITVNAVSPGYMLTPMLEDLMDRGLVDAGALRRRIPAGEFGTAADIAQAVRFLASPDASYITGANLPVDGGYSAWNTAGDAWSPTEGGL